MANAKITINGTEYTVPVMKFKQLKAAFPLIQKSREADSPIEIASAAIEVVSLAMRIEHDQMTPEWLEENMSILETKHLGEILLDIMKDSGLISDDVSIQLGEVAGAAAPVPAAPSTETSTTSSQNSLPQDAAAATG